MENIQDKKKYQQCMIENDDNSSENSEASSLRTFVNDHILTTQEVAALLGCTQSHVSRLITTGKLKPIMKDPNGYLFDNDEILDYIDQKTNGILSELLQIDRNPIEDTSLKNFVNNHVLTTLETAELLGCSRQNISLLIKKGRLKYIKKADNGYLFDRDDVVEYMDQSMDGALSRVLQTKGIDLKAEMKKNTALKEEAIDKIIVSSEVAKLLGVKNTIDVNKLILKGKLPYLRKTSHGWYLFDRDEVLAYKKKQQS